MLSFGLGWSPQKIHTQTSGNTDACVLFPEKMQTLRDKHAKVSRHFTPTQNEGHHTQLYSIITINLSPVTVKGLSTNG